MKTYNLCILGFGNIGRALAELLHEKADELRAAYGIEWRITGVATRRLGWLADANGLDVHSLLQDRSSIGPEYAKSRNVYEWLAAAQADVLFELTSLNVQTGQPAIEHICAALERGAHAVTANKGPIVHGYAELKALADAHSARFLFDAAVMGGAPLFSLFQQTLPVARLLRFSGLFNSTSNIVLAEMEQGRSFNEAVKKAQAMGLAEADPSADVDGWDATVKVCALSSVLMGVHLLPHDVARTGIRHLQPEQLRAARAERTEAGVVATVQPEQLASDDPLSVKEPASLLAHFELDVIPGFTLTLHVPDSNTAGPRIVAYNVLADFVNAVK
jgi:homoserine dehydrogenase